MISTYIQGEQTTPAGGPAGGGPVAAQGTLATPGGAGIGVLTLPRILNTIPTGRYNLAGVVLADGEGAELQLTTAGALIVATGAAPIFTAPANTERTDSGADVATLIVRALPCRYVGCCGHNGSGVTLYVYPCNLAAGPPTVASLIASPLEVAAGAPFAYFIPETDCTVGVVVGWSTTRAAYGAPGANLGWLTGFWR